MGDNGRQPLSRRVPGATDIPKAQLRRKPPKLPDHVVERLRAEVSAARAKADEQPDAKLAEEAEAAPNRLENTTRLPRPKNMDGPRFPKNVMAPEPAENADGPELPKRVAAAHAATNVEAPQPHKRVVTPQAPAQAPWQVISDSPYSPVADSDDNTEPIPVVRAAMLSPTIAPDRGLTSRADAAERREDNVVWLKKVDRPDRGRQRDNASGLDDPDQPDSASMNGRSNSVGVAGSAAHSGLAAVPARARSRRRNRPSSRPRPRPRPSRPVRLAAASRSAPDRQPTMLQTLFMETGTFDEVLASARAQAGGRRTGLEWRYRMVGLIVIALVLLGVLLVLASG
jgi:hypothetical protein